MTRVARCGHSNFSEPTAKHVRCLQDAQAHSAGSGSGVNGWPVSCGVCKCGAQLAESHWGQGLATSYTSALHEMHAWKNAPVDDWVPCLGQSISLPFGEVIEGKTFQASQTSSWWCWGSMPVVAIASGSIRWAGVDDRLPQRSQVLPLCCLPQKWHLLRKHLCHCGR